LKWLSFVALPISADSWYVSPMTRPRHIVLIQPDVPGSDAFDRLGRSHLPPLGLLYLAAALEKAGHRVRVFDLNLPQNLDEVLAHIRSTEVDLVGLGTLATAFDRVGELAKSIRYALDPKTRFVAGGADATVRPDAYLSSGHFDAVLVGEAEHTIVELVEALPDIPRIDGIAVPGGAIVLPSKIEPDSAPFPARHLLPLKAYRGGPAYKRLRYSTGIFTHRGCPFQCAFCEKGVHDGPMRARSAASIFKEVQAIRAGSDIHDLRFVDDVLMANKKVLTELLDLVLRKNERFAWMCCGRADLMEPELLGLMARAGCYRIELGLETGDQELSDRIQKNITLDQGVQAARRAHDAGIEVVANFILGFPGETETQMRKTIDYSLKAAPDYAIYFLFQPFTGAMISRELNLEWDDQESAGRGESTEYQVPTSKVQALIDKAYRRFYFRVSYVARRLLAIKSPWLAIDLARLAVLHLLTRALPKKK
jgi:radical SAM superfamily enzyme YgiQ (UPF0313 family)